MASSLPHFDANGVRDGHAAQQERRATFCRTIVTRPNCLRHRLATQSRPVFPRNRAYGISEGLRRTGYAENSTDQNRRHFRPLALAHDVPLAVVPIAALL